MTKAELIKALDSVKEHEVVCVYTEHGAADIACIAYLTKAGTKVGDKEYPTLSPFMIE